MTKTRLLLAAALLAATALSACDQAAKRTPKLAPKPAPVAAAAAAAVGVGTEIPGPIQWDRAHGAFVYNGQPLRAEKLWTFDGTTDGFAAANGDITPTEGTGLFLNEIAADPILRTPRGLNIDGHTRSLVIVRVTRVRPATPFDGSVYYTTANHGEQAAFHARPVAGKDPAVGETTTLVFDMHKLSKGDLDWRDSIIEQVRIDLDDGSGGAFVVRQVAIAQNPGVPLGDPPKGMKAAAAATTAKPAH
jgi:hypothetical protein